MKFRKLISSVAANAFAAGLLLVAPHAASSQVFQLAGPGQGKLVHGGADHASSNFGALKTKPGDHREDQRHERRLSVVARRQGVAMGSSTNPRSMRLIGPGSPKW